MHMRLRPDFAQLAVDKGWAEYHPFNDSQTGSDSDYIMLYGPRDEDEVDVAWVFVQSAWSISSDRVNRFVPASCVFTPPAAMNFRVAPAWYSARLLLRSVCKCSLRPHCWLWVVGW